MLIRLTFMLDNGNEAVLFSGLSPDMTYALVSDQKYAKNAEEVAAAIREKGPVEIYSEHEYRNKK
jgi:hypothetical protein